MTSVDAVLEVLDLLRAGGVQTWIGGGWGIDALVGGQTRPHADLDIAVVEADKALALLAGAGFEVVVDWSPGRVAVRRADGAEVDVHPIVFRADGSAVQTTHEGVEYLYPADGFTTGRIGGRKVPCITAALQAAFHSGYEPQEKDVADMATLRQAGLA
jgi:lincosamide nucleotidyltransferase A/C/D/E